MKEDKMFTFVLKDKGTNNEGWWLKISNADELADYYEKDNRSSTVISEYMNGEKHKSPLTEAIERHSANNNLTILQGLTSFRMMVATQQLEEIRERGAIYINRVGGYHGSHKSDIEYATVKRNSLTFPKDGEIIEVIEIEIKKCDKKKDEVYGFISPNGQFYEGAWSTHSELTISIIKENNYDLHDALFGQNIGINYLINNKGFILVHNPSNIEDCIVLDNGNITEEQRVFLHQYFLDSGNPWRASEYGN